MSRTDLNAFADPAAAAEFFSGRINKYADPIEGAREGLSADDAAAIAQEDPGLLWVYTTISAGDGADEDSGEVVEVDGEWVTVAWSNGERTTQRARALAGLRFHG